MIVFSAGEVIELVRYGKFVIFSFSVDIPKSEAVTITPSYPVRAPPPSVEAVYDLKAENLLIGERSHWGDTSRPNKVYYEFHQFGFPFPRALTKFDAPEWKEGFHQGAYILESNLDNYCCHILCHTNFTVKLWNTTASSPEDVWVEMTGWGFVFRKTFFPQVYNILTKNWMLLETIIKSLEQLHEDLTAIERKTVCIPRYEVEEAIDRVTDPKAR